MKKTRFLTQSAIIAAIYATLTLVFAPISYGPVQFRISEALTILPFFTPVAIPGLAIGCVIANFGSGYGIIDIVFGSFATLIAAFTTYSLRKISFGKFLAPLPPVIINALVVGAVIAYTMNGDLFNWSIFYNNFKINAVMVGSGELVACYLLGFPLLLVLNRYKDKLFKI